MAADPELCTFLEHTPFFGGLSAAALELVATRLHQRRLPAGEAVFRQGEQGGSMFVVREGALVVLHQATPGEPEVKLTRLLAGDFFGEMTLIEMQPRSASVIAETAAVLLELSARDLYELYKQDLRAYVLVVQNINRELCRRLRRTSARLSEWASYSDDRSTQVNLSPIKPG